MRWLATATLLFTGFAWQACAQRGGAPRGGGFSARSAPSFRGGFAGGSAGFRSFSPAPRAMPYRPATAYRGYAVGARPVPYRGYPARSAYSAYGSRTIPRPVPRPRPYPPRNRYGRFDGSYVSAYPYASGYWVTPWELGFPDDDTDFDASSNNGPPADASYATAPQQYAPAPDQGPYYPPEQEIAPATAGVTASQSEPEQPEPEDAVTLVFKDGRPSQQVRNYMLTRTTLTIADGHRLREVPVADLDVAATEAANRKAGVAFAVPQ
ncbi:hypothetical protein GOB94_16270 [Granulicella sp. 5B5]|uniref:hypothetical protein n=1 Tax=Granulicella sp. 5B5 TaxID=1617967 RepID=UPI0015F64594|nr:hypothetical protein [Granulicella sp. 5B5]QMV20057.1 hypothetical protein GOB94_16270 [Granulicella sp. 5B5]